MTYVMNICAFIGCGFLGVLALIILWKVFKGEINLNSLVSEANGEASMSRFQLLIFTFVVAIGILELIDKMNPAGFPPIPDGVLTLLGISASTYAVGKGISYSQPQLMKPTPPDSGDAQQAAQDATSQANVALAAADQATAAASAIAGHVETIKNSTDDAKNAAKAAQDASVAAASHVETIKASADDAKNAAVAALAAATAATAAKTAAGNADDANNSPGTGAEPGGQQ
jgi:hypothetical protein